MDKFRNIHSGGKIIVSGLGVSASLLQQTVVDCPIIGVNDMDRILTPDYLVVLNDYSSFAEGRWPHIKSTRAKWIFSHLDSVRLPIDDTNKLVKLKLGKRGGTGFDNGIGYTSNSPYVGVLLAHWMGAKSIGLIGVDWTDHHCFAETGSHPLSHLFNKIDAEYVSLHKDFSARGVSLLNLSSTSKLSLPKLDISSFLSFQ
jgi:hypothetical protein